MGLSSDLQGAALRVNSEGKSGGGKEIRRARSNGSVTYRTRDTCLFLREKNVFLKKIVFIRPADAICRMKRVNIICENRVRQERGKLIGHFPRLKFFISLHFIIFEFIVPKTRIPVIDCNKYGRRGPPVRYFSFWRLRLEVPVIAGNTYT